MSVAITDAVDTEDGCRPRDDSLAAAAVVVGTFFAVFGVFFEDLDAVDAGKAAPDGFHDASLGGHPDQEQQVVITASCYNEGLELRDQTLVNLTIVSKTSRQVGNLD